MRLNLNWLSCLGLVMALALSVSCKKEDDSAEKSAAEPAQKQGQGGGVSHEGHEGHEGHDGPGGEDDGPRWPPAGVKAPAPPGVVEVMRAMTNAVNAGDIAKVKSLFINRTQFMGVSDCDPPTVVDRVIGGRDNWMEKLKRGKSSVTFKGFTEGYLLEIKRGEKPMECRAKVDVRLYQSRYNWVLDGKAAQGEAHFLSVQDAWFFVKL
jgi:hypothetical protein